MEQLTGDPSRGIYRSHTITQNKKVVGMAVTDVHRVRSKKAAIVIGMNTDMTIRGLNVIGFQEPKEYSPPEKWLAQFRKKRLDENLKLKKGIDAITGATLTSRATVKAARRALALQEVISRRPKEKDQHDTQ